jgi:hypothetical protein
MLDPTAFDYDTQVPAASEYLSLSGLKPVSLVEMVYGPDGSMTRRYEYDVTSGSQAKYWVEHQYQGFGGQTVFSQRPGSGVQVSAVDGVGRIAWTASVVPRTTGGGGTPVVDYPVMAGWRSQTGSE